MTQVVDVTGDPGRAARLRDELVDKLITNNMITSPVVEAAFRTVPPARTAEIRKRSLRPHLPGDDQPPEGLPVLSPTGALPPAEGAQKRRCGGPEPRADRQGGECNEPVGRRRRVSAR